MYGICYNIYSMEFLVYYNWKHVPELPTRVVCIFRPSQATGLVFPSLYTWPLNKHCSVYTDSEYMHWALYTNHCLPAPHPPNTHGHSCSEEECKILKILADFYNFFLHCIFFADRIYKDFPNERALDFPDYNTRFLYSLRPMVTYLYLHMFCIVFVFVLYCICICCSQWWLRGVCGTLSTHICLNLVTALQCIESPF